MEIALWVLRALFFLVAIGLAVAQTSSGQPDQNWLVIFLFYGIGALLVIAADVLIRRKRIDLISSVYFGLVVGLFLTYVMTLALTPLFEQFALKQGTINWQALIVSFLGTSLSYLCISLLWQTRDDFRFVIPYVEFAKDLKGAKPFILDTSVVIDGRIADIVETGVIDNQLILPRFALTELQAIADSSDKLRRARGRRGLDVLNRMRGNANLDFKIYDRELPEMKGQSVDIKLLTLARHLGGKVVTGDYNLNKVAKLQNVPVINLNEVANSLKPVFLPGEQVRVKVVKPGEGPGQGIGYLDDGTMIVIEEGRSHLGEHVDITVTSMLQTNAGRMVFGRFDAVAKS
jgi:uncharacterized protein YacL